MPSFVILGARNLGGAIADRLLVDDWRGAAIARSDDTLDAIRSRGAVALRADVADPAQLRGALAAARDELGGIELLVNAVSVARFDPNVPWGGGTLADADLARYSDWAEAVTRQAFVFFSEAARLAPPPGRVIQIANSAAREADAGMGLWAAGWHGVRALAEAAAKELACPVTLLTVAGPIASPKTEATIAKLPPGAVNSQEAVADAVAVLAVQEEPPWELVVGPGAR